MIRKILLTTIAIAIFISIYLLKFSTEVRTEYNKCPKVLVNFGMAEYSTPAPYYDDEKKLKRRGPREKGSRMSLRCVYGYETEAKSYYECDGTKWIGLQETPSCVPGLTYMQKFVIYSCIILTTIITISFATSILRRICKTEKPRKSIGVGGVSYDPFRPGMDNVIPIAGMGKNIAFVLLWESCALFLGFSNFFKVFLETGVWYLNPDQRTMKNPGQEEITFHVTFGIFISIAMSLMAGMILFGKYGGPLRTTHKYVGKYVIPPIVFVFLCSAVVCELQLPGTLPQKLARNALAPWCMMVLYNVLQAACERHIAAHLHYLVAFWGLCCSAGPLRSVAIWWGWFLGCEYGWASNPCLGIVTGTLMSTLAPTIVFVYMNGTWRTSYARWSIFFAAYYQLLLPLYYKYIFTTCTPRGNMHEMYHDYAFPMPPDM